MIKRVTRQLDHAAPGRHTSTIPIVTSADDAYAIPLAVMLTSAGDHLAANTRLRVYLLDGGISDANWHRIERSIGDSPIRVERIQPPQDRFADLKISHHISHTAYFRLMAGELLPSDIEQAIYLDADLFINDDLTQLWHRDVGNRYVLAALDIACPFVDARLGSPNYRLAGPYLAVRKPIRNYRELGLDGSQPYFNSGVMLMNLQRWRKDQVAERLLACLRNNERHVWCWDQYALNVLFAGNWEALPPRWNCGAHLFKYPSLSYAPIDRDEMQTMLSDPGIIHFTTEFKPWLADSRHPYREVFYRGLEETAWQGWRPASPDPSFRRWLNRHILDWAWRTAVWSRKITSIWS